MASAMGCRSIVLLCFLFSASVSAIEVDIKSDWKEKLGWEVTCSWTIPMDDKLMSVRLYNNERQFMIYRPATHGPIRNEFFRIPQNMMNVECQVTADKGLRGRCLMTIEPFQPPTNDLNLTCEVSGERPMFKIGKKDYLIEAFVPPSDAELVVGIHKDQSPDRVSFNCSSSAIPAPALQWTVDDQQVPADFSGRLWNATTKLWQVWSSFSSAPASDRDRKVACTPVVFHAGGQLIKGHSADYTIVNNSAYRFLGVSVTVVIAYILSRLLR